MLDNFDISKLTPEQMQQLMALGGLDEQSSAIDDQIARAQALQQAQSGGHRTSTAAAIGGLGDAFRAFGGWNKERNLRGQKEELAGQRMKGRQSFAQLLFGGGQPQQAAPTPFGYGGVPEYLAATGRPYQEEEAPPFAYGYTSGTGGKKAF